MDFDDVEWDSPRTFFVLAAVAAILVMVTVFFLMSMSNQQGGNHIAVLNVTKSNEIVNYNYGNIVKDGALIVGSGFALASCTGGTLGACIAAAPAVATVLNSILNDEIISVSSDITFTNIGNGTASNIAYTVTVFSDNRTVKTENLQLQENIDAGDHKVVPYSQKITLADVAVSAWDSIQGKGKITFKVGDLTYSGGATSP